MRSETQISEQLDERLTMNDNIRYLLLIMLIINFASILIIYFKFDYFSLICCE